MYTTSLTEIEEKLIQELKTAHPVTRFKMCCNVARSLEAGWMILAALNEPMLFERVKNALEKEKYDELVPDNSDVRYFPLKNVPVMS